MEGIDCIIISFYTFAGSIVIEDFKLEKGVNYVPIAFYNKMNSLYAFLFCMSNYFHYYYFTFYFD